MSTTERWNSFLPLLLLYGPFVVLAGMLGAVSFSFEADFVQVLARAIFQSTLSAVISVCLGFVGALGLLSLKKNRISKGVEVLAVLPNFAPPILLIVAVLSTLGPGAEGVWGVVLVHSLMNVGLVSVFLKHSLQRKVSAWAQLAFLEGAERWRFWWGAGLSGVRRELFYSFLFVFALCFTSFSVPMALGASSYSLETYIFELLRVDSQPAAALGVGVIQLLILLGFALLLPRVSLTASTRNFPRRYALPAGWLIPALPVGLIFISLVDSWRYGSELVKAFEHAWPALGSAVAGSALVGLGVGYLSLMLFLWMCRYPPEPVVRRMILGTLSPSAALLGMVLLFAMPVMSHGWDFVRMIVSLTLLFFPALYRLGLDGLLQDLKIQRARAQLMGASPRLIFRDVVLPQALPLCARLSAVASLWSWGDFAMSNLVVSERKTLATLVLSLLESYRFEVAALLLTPLLLGGALTFAFFVRVGNVYPSEPQS